MDNKTLLHQDISWDTTLNTTDLSVSQEEEVSEVLSSDEDNAGKSLFKQVYKHKKKSLENSNVKYLDQLRNNVTKLNVKLKEKSFQLESIKSEYAKKNEHLQINLNKILHENELLKVQLHVEREENKIMKNNMQLRLNDIESKQGQLQASTLDIQRIFVDALNLTETQYRNLKAMDKDLSLTDFISLKLHEKHQEWKADVNSLKLRLNFKDEELHAFKVAHDKLQDDLENERRQRIELELKLERSKKSCEEFAEQFNLKDFKVDNYDTLQREKNDLEMQLSDVTKQFSILSTSREKVLRDKDEHFSELASLRQSLLLLKHDKEYLTKLLDEREGKLVLAEGKVNQLEQQAVKLRQAREDIYEKYMTSREQYRSEYEEKLKKELEYMKIQTEIEVEKLKTNVKEMSERESRSLVESRDMAFNDRDRALMQEREVMTKYEQLLLDFRHNQMSDGNTISDLNNRLKMKTFEFEKIQLLHNESMKSIKDSQLSYEKFQRKMEILLKEYYSLQTTFEKKVKNLEGELMEKNCELDFLEKFTCDLESFIKLKDVKKSQPIAKGSTHKNEYQKRNTKERLTACIDFIKMIIQTNKSNASSPSHVKDQKIEKKQNGGTTSELDMQISMLKQELSTSQLQLRNLQKENFKLANLNSQLSSDIKSLLNQDKEITIMREIVEKIKKKSKTGGMDSKTFANDPINQSGTNF